MALLKVILSCTADTWMICAVIKKRKDSEKNLAEVNNLHPSLKVTMEREENGALPQLDMKIINNGGNLSSTWYFKPSNTGLIMNYHALAPKRYKQSVVSGMVHRIYRSCSSWKNIHDSLVTAKHILVMNQYPPTFFEPIINKTLSKIIQSASEEEDRDGNVSSYSSSSDAEGSTELDADGSEDVGEDISVHVPIHNIEDKDKFKLFVQYRGKCSEHFARALHNIQAPCKIIMTLRKLKTVLPSLKPSVEWSFKSDVIYQITCPRCQVRYVGQTDRHIITRFKEHKNRSSPVANHFAECNESVETDHIEILASTIKSVTHLKVLEALYIKEIKPFLNTQLKDDYGSRKLRIKF